MLFLEQGVKAQFSWNALSVIVHAGLAVTGDARACRVCTTITKLKGGGGGERREGMRDNREGLVTELACACLVGGKEEGQFFIS